MTGGRPQPHTDHGLVLQRSELKELLQTFTATRSARMGDLPGMDTRRRSTLPVAAVLLYQLMKSLGAESLVTCEHGLREGLLQDWVDRHRPELVLEQSSLTPRRRAVEALRRRYDPDPEHSERVRDLALALFDGLVGLHGLDREARALLDHAALLHDVGHHLDAQDHEKHGQYIILHSRMDGFTAPDQGVVADVVRYHRGARPKASHRHFQAMSKANQRRVEVLSALLQVADALDRSHQGVVRSLEVSTGSQGVQIVAHPSGEAFLERWATERRTNVLASALSRPVTLTLAADVAPRRQPR
jgi:exopolyphosphatase/guanosine-5'-triphosphate,3'-diphosphate pyrophosphatase